MARYNEILVGRYNRALQKMFSMKGGPPARQLATEISVQFGFLSGVENRYLEGWNIFMGGVTVAAVAAVPGAARLRNPAGSNIIVIVESAVVTGTLPDQPFMSGGTINTDLTTVTGAIRRVDARSQGNANGIFSSQTNATNLTQFMTQKSFAANGYIDFVTYENQEIPILPGEAIQITSNVNNQVINIEFRWRERFLEDSERT
jgi:hypothetical protein